MASVKSNSFYLFIFYFLLSLLIVFTDNPASRADRRGFLTGFRQFVQGFTTPVESQVFRARTALFAPFSGFSSSAEKDRKIHELEEENARLLAQASQLKAVGEENVKARHLLGTTLPPSWHFEPARVVSVFADSMFLVGGAEPAAGMPVITSEDKSGVFVGQVKEVVGKKAIVKLTTNDFFKTTAIARDKETGGRRATGVLTGRGGKLALEQVLASETIKEGDLVLTAGDESLPPELLVGYVSRVFDKKGAFKEAEVKPAVDPAKLDYVFLITKF